MALVAINAVVDVSRYLIVLEVVGVVSAMASRALEHRVVIGVRMAGRADPVRVAVRRRELCVLRVIECRSGPGCRVMAVLARRREELWLRRVARVRGVLVIGLVTAVTRRGERSVIAVHVAIRTLPRRNRMRASQRESRVVVIECRVGPDDRVVA